jgi:hypothetical protein
MPAQRSDRELTSENPPKPPGAGDDGAAADDVQVAVPAGPGQLPPDRPRAPEPSGPPPPLPDELPRRHADPSRPSVPSRFSRQSTRAGPPDAPGLPEPYVRPLPPELFHPLWWQERPDPTSPPQPSPESGQPEPSQPEASQPEASQPEPSRPEPSRAEAPPPGQRPAAEPSWGAVLATTVQLWLRRRLSWTRRSRPGRARWLALIVAGLVAAVLLAVAVTVMVSGPGRPGAGPPGGAKAVAAAAAVRQRAAVWVAGQASPDAIVACDPAMCAALEARGVPAGRLLALTPARSDPLGSDLVVATAAVRGQFGARLVGVYAPVSLASFGSGTARIDVRVVAPDGAAAYWTALAADVRARASAGAQLLRNRSIRVSAAARTALASGEVDPRLLVTLAALSHLSPLDVTGFGGPSPGASAGVPLRSAEITGAAPPGSRHPVSLHSLMVVMQAQRAPYVPSSLEIVRIPGGAVLRIGYPVPSPLGLLRSGG